MCTDKKAFFVFSLYDDINLISLVFETILKCICKIAKSDSWLSQVCLSVCPHATTQRGWIFMKLDKCFSKLVEKIQVH